MGTRLASRHKFILDFYFDYAYFVIVEKLKLKDGKSTHKRVQIVLKIQGVCTKTYADNWQGCAKGLSNCKR